MVKLLYSTGRRGEQRLRRAERINNGFDREKEGGSFLKGRTIKLWDREGVI